MQRRVPFALTVFVTGLALWGAAVPTAGAATDPQLDAASGAAVAWLAAQQLPSGALGPTGGLDPAWSLIGFAAVGRYAADLRQAPGLPSAQDHYLELWTGTNDGAWASSGVQATDYERVMLVASAAGLDPLRLSSRQNLLAKLARYYVDGWFTSSTSLLNHTIFGLLALTRVPVPDSLIEAVAGRIEQNVHADGGYAAYQTTTPQAYAAPSNIDMTGAAIAALCAAGRTATDPSVAGAIAFLRGQRQPDGGLGNYDAAAWALQGLTTCGIHRGAPGWTADDERTVDWLLAGQLPSGGWPLSPGGSTTNFYTTQSIQRTLVPAGFTVAPPLRQDPSQPRLRPAPSVAPGTVVPTVLVVDDGLRPLRLCSGDAPAGAPLADVLAAIRDDVSAAGCVGNVASLDGRIHAIGGAVTDTASGGWRLSIDGGVEGDAPASTPVGFGQIVSLRLEDPAPVVTDRGALSFAELAPGAPAEQTVAVVNRSGAGVSIGAPGVAGPGAAAYTVTETTCAGGVVAPAGQCNVKVRFAPPAGGGFAAVLSLTVAGMDVPLRVPLSGAGQQVPSEPQPPEPDPPAPPAADPVPAPSSRTPAAAPAARLPHAACTVKTVPVARRHRAGRSRTKTTVACRVTAATGKRAGGSTRLRLQRLGRVYATGSVRALRATRAIPRGRYVLRIGSGRSAVTVPVVVRSAAARSRD